MLGLGTILGWIGLEDRVMEFEILKLNLYLFFAILPMLIKII